MLCVAKTRNIRLIMENPWSEQTYLKANFVIAPTYVDNNRMLRGDYFKKPTAYWFINCVNTIGYTYQNDKKQKIVCIKNPTTNVTNIGINISQTIHLTFCSDKNLFTIYNPTNKNVHILTNTQGIVAPIIP